MTMGMIANKVSAMGGAVMVYGNCVYVKAKTAEIKSFLRKTCLAEHGSYFIYNGFMVC